jgi:hypothetical protein
MLSVSKHIESPKLCSDDGGQMARVGMDSDVWKFELSVFVSAKYVNMDIRIHIRF